jgi:hypothetical protein
MILFPAKKGSGIKRLKINNLLRAENGMERLCGL